MVVIPLHKITGFQEGSFKYLYFDFYQGVCFNVSQERPASIFRLNEFVSEAMGKPNVICRKYGQNLANYSYNFPKNSPFYGKT
jgi:hypothetical protein